MGLLSARKPVERLARDGQPNTVVALSGGDVQHPHHIVVWQRHMVQPCYRVIAQHEIAPKENPNVVAAALWNALSGAISAGGVSNPWIIVDATVSGAAMLDAIRWHNGGSGSVAVLGYVVGVSSKLTSVSRSEIVANASNVLASNQLQASSRLLADLGRFKYDPARHTKANGEDAWRIDDCDGPGFAAGIGLKPWWHSIPFDIQRGPDDPTEKPTAEHPECNGNPMCMCRCCPRCGRNGDRLFEHFLRDTCQWCHDNPEQAARVPRPRRRRFIR